MEKFNKFNSIRFWNKATVACVKKAIDAGANINVKNRGGRTALMYNAFRGQLDIVELLLRLGADINVGGNAVLMLVTPQCYMNVIRLLISAGADVNVKNKYGDTALAVAIFVGSTTIITLLIEAGADISAKNKKGKTAFDFAHKYGKLVYVSMMEEQTSMLKIKKATRH